MSSLSKVRVVLSVVILSAVASAQIIATQPFTGQQSDGFETQQSGVFTTCIVGRAFNNTADLCDPTGNSAHITTGWGYICSIAPHSGGKLFGSAGGPAVWTFDQPATKFGGYFGTNCGVPDATAEFRDVTGAILATLPVSIPANCGWTWSGWQVTAGPAIKSIKITGFLSGGGYVHMDDMQVDYGTPCAPPVTYCTAKVNSLGCTPSIQWVGTPSATASSGCTIQAVNVRNAKAGILLYSVSGPAATAFTGGYLCLQLPVRRTPPSNSGGTPLPASDCSGVYSIDMNTYARGLMGGVPLAALQVPGTVVHCQYWGVDPGFAVPNNTALSAGLQYMVCP